PVLETPRASRQEAPAPEPTRAAPARTDVATLLGGVSAFERLSIEMACAAQGGAGGSDQYERCVRQQLASLAASAGRPDLQQASRAEQVAIEDTCAPDKRMSGPAQYYQCLRRELGRFGYGAGAGPAAATATAAAAASPRQP